MTDNMNQTFTRAERMDASQMGEQDRTVWISVSSETPAEQYFGTEVLSHDRNAVDLSFFGGGAAPLLLGHDPDDQIGVVEEAQLDTKNRRLRAKVRFSKNPKAEEVFQDVMDGIRTNVSVGYRINKTETDEKTEVVTVLKWSPKEVSIVSIPADESGGVGRSDETLEFKPEQPHRNVKMTEQIDVEKVRADATAEAERKAAETLATRERTEQEHLEAVRKEVSEIHALGARHSMTDKAAEFASQGKTLSEFRGYVLENMPENKPLDNTDIGMSGKEQRDFSMLRLLRATYRDNPQDREAAAFDLEVCR